MRLWLNKHLLGRCPHKHAFCVKLPWPLYKIVHIVTVLVYKRMCGGLLPSRPAFFYLFLLGCDTSDSILLPTACFQTTNLAYESDGSSRTSKSEIKGQWGGFSLESVLGNCPFPDS